MNTKKSPKAHDQDDKPLPLRQAFAVERCAGGWAFVTVIYKDDGSVMKITKSEPDLKPIVLEHFKIAAARSWMSQ